MSPHLVRRQIPLLMMLAACTGSTPAAGPASDAGRDAVVRDGTVTDGPGEDAAGEDGGSDAGPELDAETPDAQDAALAESGPPPTVLASDVPN